MLIYGFDKDSSTDSHDDLFIHALQEVLAYFPGDEKGCAVIQEAIDQAMVGELPVAQRLQILDEISPGIDSHIRKRRLDLLSKPLSLVSRYKQSHDTLVLQTQLAVAYISLFANDDVAKNDGAPTAEKTKATTANLFSKTLSADQLLGQGQVHPIAMHRALNHLTELQKWHYQVYYQVPNKFWKNAHYIYAQFTAQTSENFAPIQGAATHNELTLLNCYKRMLILDAINTSCMQADQVESVFSLLPKWLHNVALRNFGNRADLYFVDLTSDHGTSYQSLSQEKVSNPQTCLTLDTTEMSQELDGLFEQAQRSAEGEVKFSGHMISSRVLHHLEQTLGSKPIRKFRRTSVSEVQGKIHLAMIDDVTFAAGEADAWDIINTSAGGYCFSRQGEYLNPLMVGQMLSVIEGGDWAKGSLSIIRWLNHNKEHELQMGVELLSPVAQAMDVKIGANQIKLLFLPEVKAISESPSVILPVALAKAGDIIELPQGQATLKHRRERGPKFSHYDVAFIS